MAITEEAKAVIDEEERVLREVLVSLEDQDRRSYDRLKIESERAREFTSRIVASSRDVDKQMLASDEAVAHGLSKMKREELKVLAKLLDSPYFARLVVEEKDARGVPKSIEYRIGSEANSECRILDWRKAPASKLYYEFKEGDEYSELILGREREGRVLLRHKLEIKKGELLHVSCRLGEFSKVNGEWQAGSGSRRARAFELPDVQSLITAEQFRTITEDADTAVVIQGIAGSGKTTVALHRLGWLRRQQGADAADGRCVVIVKSEALRTYIERSLPAIGLENVPVVTFHQWLEPMIASIWRFHGQGDEDSRPTLINSGDLGERRLKESQAIEQASEAYVADQLRRLRALFAGATVLSDSTRARIQKKFAEVESVETKPRPLLPVLQEVIAIAEAEVPTENPVRATWRDIERRLQLYREDLLTLLSKPELIIEHDRTNLIDRELVSRIAKLTKERFEQGEIEMSDVALISRFAQLKTGRLHSRAALPGTNNSGAGEGTELYSQITVDEVQDYSPSEIALIIDSVNKKEQLTLVGDAGQELRSQGAFVGWSRLTSLLGRHNASRFVELTVSHRSTLPIMRFAAHLGGRDLVREGRPGKPPLWYRCRKEQSAVTEALGWLERVTTRERNASVAVLCRDLAQARYLVSLLRPTFGEGVRQFDPRDLSAEEGIFVSDIVSVKGLEFPYILLWDVSVDKYEDDPLSRNLLYVAATRAIDRLALVTWRKPSPLLPRRSDLVRVVREEIEEEESPGREKPLFSE